MMSAMLFSIFQKIAWRRQNHMQKIFFPPVQKVLFHTQTELHPAPRSSGEGRIHQWGVRRLKRVSHGFRV